MSSDRKPGARSGRRYASHALKATSHPLRERILRLLGEGSRTTPELEELTGESRYNLYHHLAVLEKSRLIRHRISEGKTKEYSLWKPERPECAVLLLDGAMPEEREALEAILEVVERYAPGKISKAEKIGRAKLLFYYPWSSRE